MNKLKKFCHKTNPLTSEPWYDPFYGKVVANDGWRMFVLDHPNNEPWLSYPKWPMAIPDYKRGVNINISAMLTTIEPHYSAYKESERVFVTLNIDGEEVTVNVKFLRQGLKELKAKTALMLFDGPFRAISFWTEKAYYVLMPANTEGTGIGTFETHQVESPIKELTHFKANSEVWEHLWPYKSLIQNLVGALTYQQSKGEPIDEYIEDLEKAIPAAKAVSGPDPILMERLQALIIEAETILNHKQ